MLRLNADAILVSLKQPSHFSHEIPNPNHPRFNNSSIDASQVKPLPFV